MHKFTKLVALLFFVPFCVFSQGQDAVFHQDVNWSPDGKYLSYSEMRMVKVEGKDSFRSDIFVIKADGTAATRITGEERNDYFSSWSPDSKRIVFGSAVRENDDSDIFAVNIDGSGLTRLTRDSGENSAPAFSPDGKRIAFASTRGGIKHQIYLMDSDGGNPKRLTTDDDVAHYNPQWSPDGEKIVYYSEKGDSKDQIWTMNADGSVPKLLTKNVGHNIFPAYTQDGRVIFSSNRDGEEDAVYSMKPDGSDVKRVEGISSSWARFSPDGKRLAWISGRWPKSAIYVANVDCPEKMQIAGQDR